MSYSRFILAAASVAMIGFATHLGLKENREQEERERLRLHDGEIMTIENADGLVTDVALPAKGYVPSNPDCDAIELTGDVEQLRRKLRCEGVEVLDWCSGKLSDADRERLVRLGAKGWHCP